MLLLLSFWFMQVLFSQDVIQIEEIIEERESVLILQDNVIH
ncbi:MAG: hypothetical protein ACXWL2_00595 [Candidatus Chromulinivorax sp.]